MPQPASIRTGDSSSMVNIMVGAIPQKQATWYSIIPEDAVTMWAWSQQPR